MSELQNETCSVCVALQNELEAAIEGYHIESANRMRAERQVRQLKRELNGSMTKETKNVKAVCDYHDEKWRALNPKARGLDYPMDGVNAAAVRKWIRRGKDFAWFKRVLDGAFMSDFHRQKPSSYLTLASVLGDENKVRRHIERLEQPAPAPIAQRPRRVRDSDWSYARTDVELELLTALEQKGCHPVEKGRGWQALCPAHEDHSPSLSVNWNGAEDKLLVKCWAGCETVYVMDALGLPLSALFRDEKRAA